MDLRRTDSALHEALAKAKPGDVVYVRLRDNGVLGLEGGATMREEPLMGVPFDQAQRSASVPRGSARGVATMVDAPVNLSGTSITARVDRILTLAGALELETAQVLARVSPDAANAKRAEKDRGEPAHLVIELEQIELILDVVRRNVHETAEAIV